MTSKSGTKLTMYVVVYNQFTNSPITVLLPIGLRTCITSFGAVLAAIQLKAQEQVAAITGTATDKLAAKEDLAVWANSTAAGVYGFAASRSDNALMEKSAYSLSELRKAKVTVLISIAKSIYSLAESNIEALVNFGISAVTQNTLKANIEVYETVTPLPRNQQSSNATITKNIDLLFKQADDILKKQIDKLMVAQAFTYLDFYNTYVSNRNIISSPTRGTQLKGKIISTSHPKGLQNVMVKYVEKGETVLSKANGSFCFKAAIIGLATITFSAEGYNDLTIKNIAIKQGQLNNQRIELAIVSI